MKKTTEQKAIEMSREVIAGSQDINNTLTVSKTTRAVFHTHYVSMDETLFGLADLIADILEARRALFPKGVELTELRKVAIAASLYTDEVISEVERRFTAGSIRYPVQSVKSFLSVFMSKDHKTLKGIEHPAKVGKIQLSKWEDCPRPCDKPRCKWYLIDNK